MVVEEEGVGHFQDPQEEVEAELHPLEDQVEEEDQAGEVLQSVVVEVEKAAQVSSLCSEKDCLPDLAASLQLMVKDVQCCRF